MSGYPYKRYQYAKRMKKRNRSEQAQKRRHEEALTRAVEAQGLPEETDGPCEPWLYERDAHALASRLTREEGVQHRAVKCESCPGWHVEEVP